MARLLVHTKDTARPGNDGHEIGDIVDRKEDGFEFGPSADLFGIVDVEGTPEELEQYKNISEIPE